MSSTPGSVSTERDVSREALVAAALALLETDGPAAITVRAVAARAGCSTMGVYTRFGSKNGLVDELCRIGFERLAAELASVPEAAHGRTEVEALLQAYRRFAIGNPALYAVVFERAVPDFVPATATRLRSTAGFDRLVSAMAAWRPGLTDRWADAAYLLLGAADGLVSLELTHRRWGGAVMTHLQGRDGEEVYTTEIGLLLDALEGLRPPA